MHRWIGVIAVVGLVPAVAGAQDVDAQRDEQARLHFQVGAEYFESGEYRDAIREFQRAYELSGRERMHYNLSGCYERLGEFEQAAEHLAAYLDRVDDVANRDALTRRLENLRERVEEHAQREAPAEPEPEPELEVGVETFHVACRGGLDPRSCVSPVSVAHFGGQPWTELRASVVDGELAAFFGAGPSAEGFMGVALHARFVYRDGHVLTDAGQPVSFPLVDAAEVGQPIGILERIATTTAPRDHGVDVIVAAELEPMVSGGLGPYPREVWVSGVRLCDSL